MKHLVTLAAAAGMSAAAVGAAQAGDLVYATHVPSVHTTSEPALMPFVEAVKEGTGGDVDILIQWGGSVAKHGAILPALRDGLADMGFLADVYAASDLPNSVVLTNMPLLGLDNRVMSGVAAEYRLLNCPACIEELEGFDAFLFDAFALPSQYLVCREPVETMADLEGLKVRVTGPLGRMLAQWGVTPVAMPVTDAYEALERGQVDCSTGIETFIKDYSWWDSAKYVLDMPLGGFPGVLNLMSRYSFDNLSEEAQAVMLAQRAPLAANSAMAYYDATVVARQEAQADHGVTYIQPSEDLLAALKAAREAEQKTALAEAEKRGAATPKKQIAILVDLAAKWEGIVAEIGEDKAAYEAALQAEIYDKIGVPE